MYNSDYDVAIIGGGFSGLVAAFYLSKAGKKVIVLEKEKYLGGLAGSFEFSNGVSVEKFYHHWFNSDEYIPVLLNDLDLSNEVRSHASKTSVYYNKFIWRLASPLDLLRFSPLSIAQRLRLGLVALYVRYVKDWRKIEHLSIEEWLRPLCGQKVYDIVWKPLVDSKFGIYSNEISAVWMWKKLVLRGGTRSKGGREELSYINGGFKRVISALENKIIDYGGIIATDTEVTEIQLEGDYIQSIQLKNDKQLKSHFVLSAVATTVLSKLISKNIQPDQKTWLNKINNVKYLANITLVLQMKRKLSDYYWINVNEPGFPFVGVIEHTNFDNPENYSGYHITYLSRYLDIENEVWSYDDYQMYNYCWEHLKKMFPNIINEDIVDYRIWRDEFAQPVTTRQYSKTKPSNSTPYKNFFITSMAHIYPEDRGTNYATREAMHLSEIILNKLGCEKYY